LPGIISACEKKWQVNITRTPVANLSFNYIAKARLDNGKKVVVKIGPPEKEFFTEMETLDRFNGNGMVRLLAGDTELRAMILEAISPGTSLREIQSKDDEKATEIGASVIQKVVLPVPKRHSLPSLANWVEVLNRIADFPLDGPVTVKRIKKAQHIFDALESSKNKDMLIHGDLHHDNILFGKNKGWVAIDPKGLIADPVYNTARFMMNWWHTNPRTGMIVRRFNIFSDITGFAKDRLIGWAYVDCMISRSWCIEEGNDPNGFPHSFPYIELLDKLVDSIF
jgi:streptomycin 6-kinase